MQKYVKYCLFLLCFLATVGCQKTPDQLIVDQKIKAEIRFFYPSQEQLINVYGEYKGEKGQKNLCYAEAGTIFSLASGNESVAKLSPECRLGSSSVAEYLHKEGAEGWIRMVSQPPCCSVIAQDSGEDSLIIENGKSKLEIPIKVKVTNRLPRITAIDGKALISDREEIKIEINAGDKKIIRFSAKDPDKHRLKFYVRLETLRYSRPQIVEIFTPAFHKREKADLVSNSRQIIKLGIFKDNGNGSGQIEITPDANLPDGAYQIIINVVDNGTPPLSNERKFMLVVKSNVVVVPQISSTANLEGIREFLALNYLNVGTVSEVACSSKQIARVHSQVPVPGTLVDKWSKVNINFSCE